MVVLFIALFGLALGSFANVLIDRVPMGKSIRGRSVCDRCRRRLRWWELVPIVSALILRHRCRTCGGRIAFRNTAIEAGAAAILLLVLWRHGGTVTFSGAVSAFGLLALFVLAVIDLRAGVVPDQISVPAIVIVVIGRLTTGVIASPDATSRGAAISALSTVVLSLAIGIGFFAVQRLVSRGKWVGDGDTRVGALMGALFAPAQLIVAIAASYIVGGAIAGVLLLTHRAERESRIPLVPFLFVGSIVAVLFAEPILRWYGFDPPLLG